MYKPKKYRNSTMTGAETYIAESIESKMTRMLNNKEPIKNELPLIHTARTEGVKPEYDIRTDKWEVAAEAMDKITQDKLQKRQEKHTKVVSINRTPNTNTSDGQTADKPGNE